MKKRIVTFVLLFALLFSLGGAGALLQKRGRGV